MWGKIKLVVFIQSRETQKTMVKWTNAGEKQNELMSNLLFTTGAPDVGCGNNMNKMEWVVESTMN